MSLLISSGSNDLQKLLHAIRYQRRAQHFLEWSLGHRHEARDLVAKKSLPGLLRDFQAVDLEGH